MAIKLEQALQDFFHLESFREGQKEIIESIVEGNDTLVFMPTGGGKSLTYQLPGVVLDGVCIVISPLISLMKDQVDSLTELGIKAKLINSTITPSQIDEILEELQSNTSNPIKFLYIAPERLNSRKFIQVISSMKISLLAIDEAHCISQWGHDFRPSYMKILSFIEKLSTIPHPDPLLRGEGEEGMRTIYKTVPTYVKDLSKTLRSFGTDSEKILWEVLRNRQFESLKFRRQHPIGRYIADFYCDELKMVIELDGKIHENQKEYDNLRDEIIASNGIKIIRINNEDVYEDLSKVFDKIYPYIPSPLRRGLGGGVAEELRLNGKRNFPIVGLTATATDKVRTDISERLGLGEYKIFISGFDRKNIIIVVREISKVSEKIDKVKEILTKTAGTGIIYCSSRKAVKELYSTLQNEGMAVGMYTGEMDATQRENMQNTFMNSGYKAIIATNAFGMGIDKKDVRFVIHYNLPGSIENYYQEVGRAGRDGKQSFGVVLASYGDTKIQEFFIENTYPEKQEILDFYDYLYKDYKLGEGKGQQILKTYYVMASESGNGNDMKVGTIIKILEKYGIIQRGYQGESDGDFRGRGITLVQEKRAKNNLLIDWNRQQNLKNEAYFKLDEVKKLFFFPHCRKKYILNYFGDKEDVESLGDNCQACDYCLEGSTKNIGDVSALLPLSAYAIVLETIKKFDEKFGQQLFVKLLCGSQEKRIFEWNLDTNKFYGALREYTLEGISAIIESLIYEGYLFRQSGKYPLMGITELGEAVLYRDKQLKENLENLNQLVASKAGANIIASASGGSKKGKKKGGSGGARAETYMETLKLFETGISFKEIAVKRELTAVTIENHIIKLYQDKKIDLMAILKITELQKLKAVKEVVTEKFSASIEKLKPIMEALESKGKKDISYFEIKITLAMMELGDI